MMFRKTPAQKVRFSPEGERADVRHEWDPCEARETATRLFRKYRWEACPRPCAFHAMARLTPDFLATPLLT